MNKLNNYLMASQQMVDSKNGGAGGGSISQGSKLADYFAVVGLNEDLMPFENTLKAKYDGRSCQFVVIMCSLTYKCRYNDRTRGALPGQGPG